MYTQKGLKGGAGARVSSIPTPGSAHPTTSVFELFFDLSSLGGAAEGHRNRAHAHRGRISGLARSCTTVPTLSHMVLCISVSKRSGIAPRVDILSLTSITSTIGDSSGNKSPRHQVVCGRKSVRPPRLERCVSPSPPPPLTLNPSFDPDIDGHELI